MPQPPRFKPPMGGCSGPEDVGKLEYNGDQDVWFECLFDTVSGEYLWVIIPPKE